MKKEHAMRSLITASILIGTTMTSLAAGNTATERPTSSPPQPHTPSVGQRGIQHRLNSESDCGPDGLPTYATSMPNPYKCGGPINYLPIEGPQGQLTIYACFTRQAVRYNPDTRMNEWANAWEGSEHNDAVYKWLASAVEAGVNDMNEADLGFRIQLNGQCDPGSERMSNAGLVFAAYPRDQDQLAGYATPCTVDTRKVGPLGRSRCGTVAINERMFTDGSPEYAQTVVIHEAFHAGLAAGHGGDGVMMPQGSRDISEQDKTQIREAIRRVYGSKHNIYMPAIHKQTDAIRRPRSKGKRVK